MKRFAKASISLLLLASAAPYAQQIYKCSDGKGGNSYQQVPCASQSQAKGVTTFTRASDSPRQPERYAPLVHRATTSVSSYVINNAGSAPSRGEEDSGYVRCIKPSGSSYLRKGDSCPPRRELVPHEAGMVGEIRTGQQRFMLPGGGNGMIDPTTGQRHELISPQPIRQVQDTAQTVSRASICARARAHLTDLDRTYNSIRRAEAQIADACGQ